MDSGATGLVMSSEFARKQGFKLKRLDRPMYVRNVDGLLNKEGPIEHTVEVNIYYQGHRERTEIDVIGGQKWTVILGMPWLARHNPEIDWKTGEVKITRCPEECGKQWRPKQGKLGWEKQKEEEAKEEAGRKREERANKQNKKQKRERTMEVKRIVCYDRCLLESTQTWVKGMTTTIGCAEVVSVSASCSRHCNLT